MIEVFPDLRIKYLIMRLNLSYNYLTLPRFNKFTRFKDINCFSINPIIFNKIGMLFTIYSNLKEINR